MIWYVKDNNHIYRFKLDPKIIDTYSYKYKFWDTTENTIKDGQIYSSYSQFLGKVFNFKRDALKGLNLIVRLNEEQTFIESFFLHRRSIGGTEYLNFVLGKAYYRDINLFYVYDNQNKQWFTSGPDFFNEAIFEKVRNRNFDLKAFAKQYYHVDKKRNGYAIGSVDQKRALGNRSNLMPIIFDLNNIWVAPNEPFYTVENAAQMRGRTFLTQPGMKNLGSYTLNDDDDLKKLRSMLPNFQLRQLHKWMKYTLSAQNYQNELIFYPYNYYESFGQVGYPAVGFQAVSQATQKFKEWLGTDFRIFMKPYILMKKIPKPLKYCEELFDKDVLEIKQLVKDIGDLKTLIHREQKNFVLYDDSNIIDNTFFAEQIILWNNLIAIR